MKKTVQDFKSSSTRLQPGETQVIHATLSWHLRVHVMNELCQFDDNICWTAPLADQNHDYPVSTHFKGIAGKKTPYSNIIIQWSSTAYLLNLYKKTLETSPNDGLCLNQMTLKGATKVMLWLMLFHLPNAN